VVVAPHAGRNYPDPHVRPLTRSGLAFAIAVAVIALPTAATGAPSAPAATAANSATYQDSSGENPAAPDITTLVVSNTDAGIVSFRINIPNRSTFSADMLIAVEVDTDNNATTGSPEGTEYAIEIFQGEAALFRWDGTNFTRRPGDPPFTSLLFDYGSGGMTIRMSSAELGNTKAFKFAAFVFSGIAVDPTTGALDFTNAAADVAPALGAGLYAYEVRITPATLVVRSLKPTPARPTAGRPFTLRLVAARSDTNAVVRNGRVTCVGRVGNARLRARVQAVQGGAATCTWNIPANARGKSFRGSVAIVFEGLRASQGYTSRVR
jgi:hypothetical protein